MRFLCEFTEITPILVSDDYAAKLILQIIKVGGEKKLKDQISPPAFSILPY
ncbi:MAG: hypothetical protein P8Y68_14525 [Anaerolineales bacterium]